MSLSIDFLPSLYCLESTESNWAKVASKLLIVSCSTETVFQTKLILIYSAYYASWNCSFLTSLSLLALSVVYSVLASLIIPCWKTNYPFNHSMAAVWTATIVAASSPFAPSLVAVSFLIAPLIPAMNVYLYST
jgi:hypothetical protein